jgi:hypothetical protein
VELLANLGLSRRASSRSLNREGAIRARVFEVKCVRYFKYTLFTPIWDFQSPGSETTNRGSAQFEIEHLRMNRPSSSPRAAPSGRREDRTLIIDFNYLGIEPTANRIQLANPPFSAYYKYVR